MAIIDTALWVLFEVLSQVEKKTVSVIESDCLCCDVGAKTEETVKQWAPDTSQEACYLLHSIWGWRKNWAWRFRVCKSVHHHTFNWVNQKDAATSL